MQLTENMGIENILVWGNTFSPKLCYNKLNGPPICPRHGNEYWWTVWVFLNMKLWKPLASEYKDFKGTGKMKMLRTKL